MPGQGGGALQLGSSYGRERLHQDGCNAFLGPAPCLGRGKEGRGWGKRQAPQHTLSGSMLGGPACLSDAGTARRVPVCVDAVIHSHTAWRPPELETPCSVIIPPDPPPPPPLSAAPLEGAVAPTHDATRHPTWSTLRRGSRPCSETSRAAREGATAMYSGTAAVQPAASPSRSSSTCSPMCSTTGAAAPERRGAASPPMCAKVEDARSTMPAAAAEARLRAASTAGPRAARHGARGRGGEG